MADMKKQLKIKFHSVKPDGGCYVDVELPESGKCVNYIKLKRERGGRIIFELPRFLNNRWSYSEISLGELYKRITEEYEKFTAIGAGNDAKKAKAADIPSDESSAEEPTFTFSALDTKISAIADVVLPDIAVPLSGIFVQGNLSDDTVFVKKPAIISDIPELNEKAWYDLSTDIEYKFRKSFMGLGAERECGCEVSFSKPKTFYTCLADAHFSSPKKDIGGFSVKIYSISNVRIDKPHYISAWNERIYEWGKLTRLMSASVLEKYPVASEFISEPRKEKGAKELTPAGRIANAEKSDFRYIPGSVLISDGSVPDSERKNIHILAAAMSKGIMGGIGPYEFGVLKWVARLKYLTTVMLQELTYYGYIDTGWRGSIKRDKYAELIKRMLVYDILNRSHFGTLDEDGVLSAVGFSASKVLTVGKNGGMVLKEFAIEGNRYNPFDVIREAHTIKSSLTVNQWLIYWLRAFKNRIGDNFDSAFVMKRIGAQYTAARLYATVQVDDKVLVGEAVRRGDSSQQDANCEFLRNKLERMIQIFDNPDEMYKETRKITYPSRPIINLICEDDEHISEIYEVIKDIIKNNPQQKIWFTHDLRVFNMCYIGQRFICMDSGEPVIVELSEIFGADDERETQALAQKFTKPAGVSEDADDNGGTDSDGDEAGEYSYDNEALAEASDEDGSEDAETETEDTYGFDWS